MLAAIARAWENIRLVQNAWARFKVAFGKWVFGDVEEKLVLCIQWWHIDYSSSPNARRAM
jgi:hypothetical protein